MRTGTVMAGPAKRLGLVMLRPVPLPPPPNVLSVIRLSTKMVIVRVTSTPVFICKWVVTVRVFPPLLQSMPRNALRGRSMEAAILASSKDRNIYKR